MCKQIDTVKNIVTRDSQFAKQGITVLNDFGLVDGSNNGIDWG
jgi:dUTPase